MAHRTVEPEDQPLLRALFAESRPDLTLLPEPVRGELLDMQLRARTQQYLTAYPLARHDILVADGVDVGSLIVDDRGEAVRIVDITIALDQRGRGIGTAVISALIATGRPVRLSVWSGNSGARRLYDRLGFEAAATADTNGYHELQHHSARQEGS